MSKRKIRKFILGESSTLAWLGVICLIALIVGAVIYAWHTEIGGFKPVVIKWIPFLGE